NASPIGAPPSSNLLFSRRFAIEQGPALQQGSALQHAPALQQGDGAPSNPPASGPALMAAVKHQHGFRENRIAGANGPMYTIQTEHETSPMESCHGYWHDGFGCGFLRSGLGGGSTSGGRDE